MGKFHHSKTWNPVTEYHIHTGKLQIDFMKKKEMNLMDHKRTMRTFNERLRVLDDQLDDEKHTKSARVMNVEP